MTSLPRLRSAALVACCLIAPSVGAQSATPRAAVAMESLAQALLRLDYAIRERPPIADSVAAVHRAFDQASLAFFGGRNAQVLATIDSLTHALMPDTAGVARLARMAAEALAGTPAATRRLVVGTDTIPYRLFVPTRTKGRRPLLMAFHGAGGNEHMFALSYGAGELQRLAQAKGVVVVMPLSNAFLRGAPERFDALVSAVSEATPIDTTRIMLLGHSLGGIVAGQLATTRGNRVIAVACIASPCAGPADATAQPTDTRRAPALVLAAANDLVIPLPRIQAAVAGAQRVGRTIELRTIANQGHTLVVPNALPDAMTWLLSQNR